MIEFPSMIDRDLAPELIQASTRAPAITITGPRQSGKTTLCRALFPDHPYRTLEAPDERAFAESDPRGFLAQLPDGAVIDEIQHVPELLSYLQGIIDDNPAPGRWIFSGSQNLHLLQSFTQSLAGRTEVYHLLPLTWSEIKRFAQHPPGLEEALFSGGYPQIFDQELDPSAWLRSYVSTYLERDVRMIRNIGNLAAFQRFIGLCAGRTAQLLNYSSLANDCGISQPCARDWFSILEASFITFHLPAFNANLRKRLVKMPKLYFHDTGLVCWLLGIRDPEQLRLHPLRGAIFESWVVSEICKHRNNQGETRDLSFYRDRNGIEIDLVIDYPAGRTLLEAKSSMTPPPGMFRTARRVRNDFPDPDSLDMVVGYGGNEFQLRSDGRLIPWNMLLAVMRPVANAVVRVCNKKGRPVTDANLLVLFPNQTWKEARTDEQGEVILELHSSHLPMALFVAARGFAAHLERDWIPAERILHIRLSPLRDGGSILFPQAVGSIPGLTGQLNPKRDTHGRTYLYARNIAINQGHPQPVSFQPGEEMHLCDANGKEFLVRILEVTGRSALVEYRQCPPPQMKGDRDVGQG